MIASLQGPAPASAAIHSPQALDSLEPNLLPVVRNPIRVTRKLAVVKASCFPAAIVRPLLPSLDPHAAAGPSSIEWESRQVVAMVAIPSTSLLASQV